MSEILFRAVSFASDAHTGQYRKGTKIPYIVHPISVMETLINYGASECAIVAGVLHDTLEDSSATLAELRSNFGDRVTELVVGASEPNKDQSWCARKEHTIAVLSEITDTDQLMVICADKLHNVLSITHDVCEYGNAVWHRFNRGYADQKWYYTSLAEIFARHASKSKLFSDYISAVQHLFSE